jgi:hypothetical protein
MVGTVNDGDIHNGNLVLPEGRANGHGSDER